MHIDPEQRSGIILEAIVSTRFFGLFERDQVKFLLLQPGDRPLYCTPTLSNNDPVSKSCTVGERREQLRMQVHSFDFNP